MRRRLAGVLVLGVAVLWACTHVGDFIYLAIATYPALPPDTEIQVLDREYHPTATIDRIIATHDLIATFTVSKNFTVSKQRRVAESSAILDRAREKGREIGAHVLIYNIPPDEWVHLGLAQPRHAFAAFRRKS